MSSVVPGARSLACQVGLLKKGAVFPTPLIEWPAGVRVRSGRFFPHTPSSLPVRFMSSVVPGAPGLMVPQEMPVPQVLLPWSSR